MRLYDRDQQGGRPAPAMRPDQRERPPIMHHSVHATREAEADRVDLHPEFDANRTFNPTSLEAPPPRAGFAQRWITDATGPNATKSEKRNWFAKQRQGWSLRDPESVPPALRHLYPSSKLSDGQIAIAVAGMVLGEIPLNVANERRLAVNDRIQHLSKSVPESTQELAARARRGVGPLEVVDHVNTYRGRQPGVMAN
jgi:hypothetical protein